MTHRAKLLPPDHCHALSIHYPIRRPPSTGIRARFSHYRSFHPSAASTPRPRLDIKMTINVPLSNRDPIITSVVRRRVSFHYRAFLLGREDILAVGCLRGGIFGNGDRHYTRLAKTIPIHRASVMITIRICCRAQ